MKKLLLTLVTLGIIVLSCAGCICERQRSAQEFVGRHSTDRMKQLIQEKTISIGMNTEEVIASRGLPNNIHKTVGSWGVHEQWIYGSPLYRGCFYLYFEDGKVTAWQN